MSPIRVVVFDLGKVLVDFDYRIAARNVAARGKISAEELARVMAGSPLLYDYERGRYTNAQFYQQVCALSGYSGDIDAFRKSFASIFTPILPMVSLHSELRQRKFGTYIFSNTNDFAVSEIRSSFPFFSNFDGYILSYQHGSLKPEAKLYEVVEHISKTSGAEILYLDDRPENIEAGAARGWQVILHESPESSYNSVRKLGLLNHR